MKGIESNFKVKLLIYFSALSAGTLLLSNLAAIKLWDLAGIAVDGGLIIFPLTYIIGDLTVEFFGKKISKAIIFAGFLLNVIAVIVFYIVIGLPPFPGWGMQGSYASVLGFAPRIIAGSLTSYVCSNLFNNYVFVRMKESEGIFHRSFIARALGSSAFAHIIDSGIFETIAFFGVLPFHDFLNQAVFACILGFLLEILLSPIENGIEKSLRRKWTKA